MTSASKAALSLPEVTLACVDTRTPALGAAALQRCMAQAEFGRALLFTDPSRFDGTLPGIEIVPVEMPSVAAYSRFMLRDLVAHIHTSHVLVVQWDGFVIDAGQWDPAFLAWDYIGAPLRDVPPERAVGNGGFSLRSKRLLQALQDPALSVHHPEDLCICHDNRARLELHHAIRFAPLALAQRFAYERVLPPGPTFGFHGLFNLQRVLAPQAFHTLVQSLPDELARGLDAHDLCRALLDAGDLDTADALLAKRRRLGMHDRRTLRLRWQRWLLQGRRRLGRAD